MARAKERVYQPEPDEPPPRPPSGSNTALAMAVSAFAVLVLGAVVWANMGGIVSAPTIKPDVAAFKEPDPDAALEAAAPVDRAVYDVIEGQGEVARPLPPAALAKAAQAAATADPAPPSATQPAPSDGPIKLEPLTPTPAPATPVQAAPAKPAPAKPAPPVSGQVVVQLAALSSEAAGRSLWDRVQKAAPGPAGAGLMIQPNAPSGATIYRVRVGPFANRDAATAYCGQIRAKSFDCQVIAP